MFASFGTAQMLSPKILRDNDFGNLGFYEMSLFFMTLGLGSFISTSLVTYLGQRLTLFLAALSYALHTGCYILPVLRVEYPDSTLLLLDKTFCQAFVILAACLNGLGGSIIWVAHGKYISECAQESNKGMFNAIFWAIYIMSYCVGNSIGATILDSVKPSVFYIILSGICTFSAIWFYFIPTPVCTG
jgi:hypothetical protein